jgi:putative Mg2+ transporter-C (MgtC) family protein
MTFYSMMQQSFTVPQQLELVLRVVVATLCGMILGVERSRRFKDAGIRTHCIVACAAALLMVVSKYGFADLTDLATDTLFPGTRGADAARIAAQVVSGVSFLGAGLIYRDKTQTTKGLTTAAGVWATAAIGLAVGCGMYFIGIFATALMMFLQFWTHRVAVGSDQYNTQRLEAVVRDNDEARKILTDQMEQWGLILMESKVSREGEYMRFQLLVRQKGRVAPMEITKFVVDNPSVQSLEMSEVL